jgi:hypothetical protein
MDADEHRFRIYDACWVVSDELLWGKKDWPWQGNIEKGGAFILHNRFPQFEDDFHRKAELNGRDYSAYGYTGGSESSHWCIHRNIRASSRYLETNW